MPMSKYTDGTDPQWSELAQSLATSRDVESFMRIYDHFAPRIGRYLASLGAVDGQVEEFTQETMLKLWLKADAFDPKKAALSTWLFRVARNLYIDHIRKDGAWMALQSSLDEQSQEEGLKIAAPVPAIGEDGRMEALTAALGLLTDLQSRVIQMSYFEAKSHSQIAVELDMPIGSVKTHIRTAYAILRSRVGE